MVEPVRRLLLVLMGTVGAVLLIACVNVASLVARPHRLAPANGDLVHPGRAWRRTRPSIRHLLTENVLLGATGGAAGIALAVGGLRLLRTLATTLARWDLGLQVAFPRLDEIAIDPPVLTFTIVASVAPVFCAASRPRYGTRPPIR